MNDTLPNDYMTNEIDCELVVGLVCAVGTRKKQVIDHLVERFERAGYSVELVKVTSDVIPLLEEVPNHNRDQFKRISDLMDVGN